MPKSCAARQCCNRYSNRRKQLTFHRFPFSRPALLQEWVLNMGRAGFAPKRHTVICSEHFRPECFSAFGNRKNLKHNAVPTEFAFQGAAPLVSEKPEPAVPGDADSAGEPGPACRSQGHPEAGSRADGPGRSVDAELRLSPKADGRPVKQVLPPRAEAAGGPTGLRSALLTQPPDHSYALLDLDALKRKLFLTLRENQKLRKRLRAQRLLLRGLCGQRGGGHRAGQQARAPPSA